MPDPRDSWNNIVAHLHLTHKYPFTKLVKHKAKISSVQVQDRFNAR